MSFLPVDSIANIASFLTLREQVKAFPEFNDCLKQVEGKKKLIRRAVYNWRLDYIEGGWHKFSKPDLKRFVPLVARKQLLEDIKGNCYHALHHMALEGATFADIVDNTEGVDAFSLLLRSRYITKMHHQKYA